VRDSDRSESARRLLGTSLFLLGPRKPAQQSTETAVGIKRVPVIDSVGAQFDTRIAISMTERYQDEMTESHATTRRAGKAAPLTALDWAILDVLTRDPLASNRAIAETLKLPLAQVGARIRLLERRKLSHVLAALDLRASGQAFGFILIDVQGRPLEEVAAELGAIREVMMVSALTGGTHDLLVIVRFKSVLVLQESIFGRIFPIEGVYQTCTSIVLDVPIFRSQYVSYAPNFLPNDIEANRRDLEMDYAEGVLDDLDRSIIAELQVNGRQSINSISRKYGINASTIRYRVRSLESRGLMRFITILDPPAIGLDTFALIEIQVEASKIPSVIESLRQKRWLPQLFLCAGPAALMGIVLADSVNTVRRLKTEEIRQIDGVIGANVSLLVRTYKMDMRWGQRYTEWLPIMEKTAT
jgi:DNA-binding Lrp family transcriptional regulator